MAISKIWNGTEWVVETDFKAYNSASGTHERGIGKYWTGTEWVIFTRQTVDSHEDGDLSEYVFPSEITPHADFNVVTGTDAVHGNYLVEIVNSQDGGGAIDTAVSTAGLPRYPSRGDRLGAFFQANLNGEMKAILNWVAQSDRHGYPNGYHVWVDGRDNTLYLVKFHNANDRVDLAQSPFDATAWDNGEMCRVDVSFGDPTITASLYDSSGGLMGQVSADDIEFDTGGICFGLQKGTPSDTTAVLKHDWYFLIPGAA